MFFLASATPVVFVLREEMTTSNTSRGLRLSRDRCLVTTQVVTWNDLLLKQTTGCVSITDCKTGCNTDPGVGIKCYKMQCKTLWKGRAVFKESWYQSLGPSVFLPYCYVQSKPPKCTWLSSQAEITCVVIWGSNNATCQILSYPSWFPLGRSRGSFWTDLLCPLGMQIFWCAFVC